MSEQPQARSSGIRSMGELAIRRPLERTETGGYAPGQMAVKILDPRPHRDRADLAALLTFVDDDGVLWDVTCLRYRDDQGWQAIKAGRYTAEGKIDTHTAVALGFRLSDEHLALLGQTVLPGFPYEPASEDEKRVRRAASALVNRVLREAK